MKNYRNWILAGSVVVNLLLVGFIAGRMMPPPPLPDSKEERQALDNLPAAKREQLETIMQKSRKRMAEDAKQARSLRKDMIAILEAPEFDERAFITKSKELDVLFPKSRRQMIDEMAALAKESTQEERRIMAKQLRRPPPHRGPPPPKPKD
ncbi:MAG: periplasmic heavy metal sensor [Alphaproteobacteria bacterium]|nr:periplasmic heavy metal sensor [Alphaproteobacteria bacterium]